MAALPSSIMEGQWCGTPTGEVTLDILFRLPLAGRRDFKVVRTTLSHATAMPTGKILLEVRLLLHVRISHFQRQENTGGLLSQQAVGAFFRQLILNGSKRFLFRTRVLRLISLFKLAGRFKRRGVLRFPSFWFFVFWWSVCGVSWRGSVWVFSCSCFLSFSFSSLLWFFVGAGCFLPSRLCVSFPLALVWVPSLFFVFVFWFCFCFLLVLLFCCFGFWFVWSFVWCWFCFVCPLLLSLVFCFWFWFCCLFCLSLFLSGLFGCCFCFVVLSLFVFVFGFVCPLWCPLSFVCVVFVAFPFCFCLGLSLVVFCWRCCSFVFGSPWFSLFFVFPFSPSFLVSFLVFSFFRCGSSFSSFPNLHLCRDFPCFLFFQFLSYLLSILFA
ncbi:unnamed protein product [Polarella glacialis]|uniref:Uncharacterized protein n=1 Tax=Polarella glacialis TaxID=89957 RepID=A0A813IYM4_POLGL|nr:unnamed protein product [Polarella glacialis]